MQQIDGKQADDGLEGGEAVTGVSEEGGYSLFECGSGDEVDQFQLFLKCIPVRGSG